MADPQDLLEVKYAGDTFLAIWRGPFGLQNRVLSSPDGSRWTTWRVSYEPAEGNLQAVAYGNGLFVAGGLDGNILTSPDAISWTWRSTRKDLTLYDITYGNGIFVAVGDNRTNSAGLSSTNGIDWVPWSVPIQPWLINVTYGNGVFVATRGDYPGYLIASTNGLDWTIAQTNSECRWPEVVFAQNAFYAASRVRCGFWKSLDGFHWTSHTNGLMAPEGIAYGNGLFLLAAWDGGATSQDTSDWAVYQKPFQEQPSFLRLRFLNQAFYLVAGKAGLFRSIDGTNWSQHLTARTPAVGAVTYGQGRIVSVVDAGLFVSGLVVPRPMLRTENLTSSGRTGVALTLSSEPGIDLDLEISDDLSTWRLFQKLPNPDGTVDLVDDPGSGIPRRFYRVKNSAP